MRRLVDRRSLAIGGGLILAAGAAVAGSGVGGVFNLGTTNTVNADTTLQGSTTGQQLTVNNTSTSAGAEAIYGNSAGGVGVLAFSNTHIGLRAGTRGTTGADYAVYATTPSRDGLAGFFQNTSTTTDPDKGAGIRGVAADAVGNEIPSEYYAGGGEFIGGNGVIGVATEESGNGVRGYAPVPDGFGVVGIGAGANGTGVYGQATAATGAASGVHGETASADGFAGYFRNTSSTTSEFRGTGIRGLAAGASQAQFSGLRAAGGAFAGPNGVVGVASISNGYGILAVQGVGSQALYSSGDAYINGFLHVTRNLSVAGNLTKGSGTFKIDHPLDPANKYLSHSFVESPDMMNIYNGNVVTDASGAAVVELPGYFEALNRDPRYQLTVIGSPVVAYIAEEISGNVFSIKTEEPNTKVSWQVTGIRRDAYAEAHPIVVEEEKKLAERGRYLHPEEHGQPADLAIHNAQDPTQAAAAAPAQADGG